MWFDSWSAIGRVLAVGSLAYVGLVVALRLSGKRTLSQLNVFDFVITVALGSTLATIVLSKDVAWAEGITAVVLLTVLQYVVAKLSVRWPFFRRAVTSSPTLLARDGRLDEAALRRQRLTASQVRQSARSSGYGDLAQVAAIVLEPDGTLSVIPVSQLGSGAALADVTGWPTDQPNP